jgi:ribosomal protein S18 acetylase RimI-like enzyme
MIHKLTDKTELKTFEKIVDIHRLCISQSNAPYYPPEVIDEWLDQVNIDDTISQLKYSSWIVVEDEGEIVGFAQYSLSEEELYQMQVNPTLQRKGYGRELYEYIEEDFRKNDIKKMELYSVLNAVEFYKSLGFKKKRKIFFPLKKTKTELEVMTKKL